MNIDMAALRSLEREKDVTFEQLVEAIEAALLVAYQRTEGAQRMRAWCSIAPPAT